MAVKTSISKTWTCDRCGEKATLDECSIDLHMPQNWRIVQLSYNDYADNPGLPHWLCSECVLHFQYFMQGGKVKPVPVVAFR